MSSAALALPTPLSSEHSALLAQFAAGTDAPGLLWASGYLAGLARALDVPAQAPAPVAAATPATVLYGSQTGNARRAAEALHASLAAAGLPARLVRADAYPLRELKDERLLYIAISTQGDGDPPDDALGFVDFRSGKRAPQLPQLKYAVLALAACDRADETQQDRHDPAHGIRAGLEQPGQQADHQAADHVSENAVEHALSPMVDG